MNLESMTESATEDRRPETDGSMSPVDELLTFLVEDTRNIAARMAAAGYDEYEVRQAWDEARRLGYTEATGLGQDRLTEAGRNRAIGRASSY